jgi:branched-chain amino acid transport system substrate-binding protein
VSTRRNRTKRTLAAAILLVVGVSCHLLACSEAKAPVKIGFASSLTGKHSDLGIPARNAVMLAVKEKNQQGGLLGRSIALLVKDDRYDPETAVKVDRELIDSGVVAIIGHVTSSMSEAVLPLINEKKMLMISPTTASSRLAGIKDHFFRMYEPVRASATQLAELAFRRHSVRTMAAIYDLANEAYSADYFDSFRSAYEQVGGRMVQTQTFVSGQVGGFLHLVEKMKESNPDGVLVIAGGVDTALICQQIAKLSWHPALFASPWSMTNDVVKHGGRSVDGILSIISLNPDDDSPHYQAFRDKFRAEFGQQPGFSAVCAFEAATALFMAYEQARGEVTKLPQTLLAIKQFPGLQGDVVIDEYGDAHREGFITTVQNGRMIRMREQNEGAPAAQ